MAGPVRTTRRIFLAGAPALLCSACGNSYLTDVPALLRSYVAKGDDLHLTRADIDRIPYASLAVRMGDGPQVLVVLGRYDGDRLDWISAQSEVIVTRRGRLVKTYGLPQDLTQTVFLTADPVGQPSRALAAGHQCLRTIDVDPGHHDGMVVTSRFEKIGDEAIEILGDRVATELWREVGAAPDVAWEFDNRYWIDPGSGYVWKSRQAATPSLPPLEITVYRRAV
jgi:hypothetical protein